MLVSLNAQFIHISAELDADINQYPRDTSLVRLRSVLCCPSLVCTTKPRFSNMSVMINVGMCMLICFWNAM